jgi:hypothetical protein
MRHLVSVVDDRAHDVGVTVCGVTGDEERRPDVVTGQQVENARHADQRAVRLVAHGRHAVAVGHRDAEQRRLGVDVERERRRGRLPVRPRHGRRRNSHDRLASRDANS